MKKVTPEQFKNRVISEFIKAVKETEKTRTSTEDRNRWIRREWMFYRMDVLKFLSGDNDEGSNAEDWDYYKIIPKDPPQC